MRRTNTHTLTSKLWWKISLDMIRWSRRQILEQINVSRAFCFDVFRHHPSGSNILYISFDDAISRDLVHVHVSWDIEIFWCSPRISRTRGLLFAPRGSRDLPPMMFSRSRDHFNASRGSQDLEIFLCSPRISRSRDLLTAPRGYQDLPPMMFSRSLHAWTAWTYVSLCVGRCYCRYNVKLSWGIWEFIRFFCVCVISSVFTHLSVP